MEYTRFIVKAKKKGINTFVDCSGKGLIDVLAANPYCIHINNHEGFEVFQQHSPLKIAGAVLKDCDLAAVTCGADGLYLASKNHSTVHANCKLDSIFSSVGSGDSLMAGLVVAYKRKLNLSEIAKLAVACGAANCVREELGMFYKRDVEKLIAKTELTIIDNQIKSESINSLKA